MVLALVGAIRRNHARMGSKKLYNLTKGDMVKMGIKLGRDGFLNVLRHNGLLVERRRRGTYTTQSRHWMTCYPNLVEGLVVDRPEQLWVADITYIRLVDGFCYLSLITDAYSRKIVGFYLSRTLEAEGSLEALRMALAGRMYTWTVIHHSDRGIQYCSYEYVAVLREAGFPISMTYQGNGENAIAERVNGILKDEYLLSATFESFEAAKKQMKQSIFFYNTERPHLSVDMLTPAQAHLQTGALKKHWHAPIERAA